MIECERSNTPNYNFMMVNIAWNHSGWSLLEPNPDIGFGFVHRPNEAAYSPHEALNFDFNKKNIDTADYLFGYFQTRGIPRQFRIGGLIFFWSMSTDDNRGYFVGVYGDACVHNGVEKWPFKGFYNDECWANIRGKKTLSFRFPFQVDSRSCFPCRTRLIYRSNLSYNLDKNDALKILSMARDACLKNISNATDIKKLEVIKKYVMDHL